MVDTLEYVLFKIICEYVNAMDLSYIWWTIPTN